VDIAVLGIYNPTPDSDHIGVMKLDQNYLIDVLLRFVNRETNEWASYFRYSSVHGNAIGPFQ
jgi:hypothetical protein